jgi:hypothetical protein
METITYSCTHGISGTGWYNVNNVWDDTASTYTHSYTVKKEDTQGYILARTTATGLGDITKVEIGATGYRTGTFNYAYIGASFSGSYYTIIEWYKLYLEPTPDTYWFDITSGTAAPIMYEDRGWDNSDINNANLFLTARLESPIRESLFDAGYIDQLYWRVTYSG